MVCAREQQVCADVILIGGVLRHAHAGQAGAERQISARFRCNCREMTDFRQLHHRLPRVVPSPLKTAIAGLDPRADDVGY
jgi:hypothetical protein